MVPNRLVCVVDERCCRWQHTCLSVLCVYMYERVVSSFQLLSSWWTRFGGGCCALLVGWMDGWIDCFGDFVRCVGSERERQTQAERERRGTERNESKHNTVDPGKRFRLHDAVLGQRVVLRVVVAGCHRVRPCPGLLFACVTHRDVNTGYLVSNIRACFINVNIASADCDRWALGNRLLFVCLSVCLEGFGRFVTMVSTWETRLLLFLSWDNPSPPRNIGVRPRFCIVLLLLPLPLHPHAYVHI